MLAVLFPSDFFNPFNPALPFAFIRADANDLGQSRLSKSPFVKVPLTLPLHKPAMTTTTSSPGTAILRRVTRGERPWLL